jgi:hypothetical protein
MVGNYLPAAAEYIRILPEIVLCIFGVALMVLEAITNERQKPALGIFSLVGIVAAFVANLYSFTNPGQACSGCRVSLYARIVRLSAPRKGRDGRVLCADPFLDYWPVHSVDGQRSDHGVHWP